MVVKTESCRQYAHPEFSNESRGTAIATDVEFLARSLERRVSEGERFLPGETLRVGWLETTIRETREGDLTLWEPDFIDLPVNWIGGIDYTLSQLRLQKDSVESAGLDEHICFPMFRESALVGADVSSGISHFILERFEARHPDSGWFLGRAASDLDYNALNCLRRVSLYECALLCPKAINFLAFPEGSRVVASESKAVLHFRNQPLRLKPESLLARLYPTH